MCFFIRCALTVKILYLGLLVCSSIFYQRHVCTCTLEVDSLVGMFFEVLSPGAPWAAP